MSKHAHTQTQHVVCEDGMAVRLSTTTWHVSNWHCYYYDHVIMVLLVAPMHTDRVRAGSSVVSGPVDWGFRWYSITWIKKVHALSLSLSLSLFSLSLLLLGSGLLHSGYSCGDHQSDWQLFWGTYSNLHMSEYTHTLCHVCWGGTKWLFHLKYVCTYWFTSQACPPYIVAMLKDCRIPLYSSNVVSVTNHSCTNNAWVSWGITLENGDQCRLFRG